LNREPFESWEFDVKPIITRRQKDTIFAGIFCVVALLVVMQLWLLTATMNAYMGGDNSVVWPGAIASLACFLVNLLLLRRLLYLQQPAA
jgi:phosphoribulokinase